MHPNLTNWVTPAANASATLTLDLNNLGSGVDAYSFGTPRTFTIFARNSDGEVYQGRNLQIQMNKLTFHSNGDGVQYTPTLPTVSGSTDWSGAVSESTPANPKNGSQTVRYLLGGTNTTPVSTDTLGTYLPALPSLNGWNEEDGESAGWVFNSGSPTTGCPFGDTSTYSDANSPGKGTCAGEFTDSTEVQSNAEIYAVWNYHPKILDFSPKKGLKSEPTPITVAVYPLVPWGKTLPTDKAALDNATHIKFGAGGVEPGESAPECGNVNIISNTELECVMPAGSGSGRLWFKNE